MNRSLRVLAVACAVSIGANAAIVTSIEASGVEHATFGGKVEETFESKPIGVFSGAGAVGTYSAGGETVRTTDKYGSSDRYLTVGRINSTTSTPGGAPYSYSLTFDTPQSYFGFFWAAIDGSDKFQLYSGDTLLATYDWTLFASLTDDYYKVNGEETPPTTKEAYAFVNFAGTLGTTFTKVIFDNGGSGTGFETDNHTILVDTTVRSDEAPEPATFALAGVALALLAWKMRKQKLTSN